MTDAAADPGVAARWAGRSLLGLCALAIAALALQIGLMQHGRDQAVYSVVALVMLDGGSPYLDAWDIKPPGVYFVYAAAHALFGASMHAVRALEVLALAAMIGGFAVLSRRVAGGWRLGAVAGVVALAYHVVLDFWDTAQPESFAGALVVWAIVLALLRSPAAGRQRAAWFASGALFGLAGAMKPPLAGGSAIAFAVVALHLWRESQSPRRWQNVAVALLCFAAGLGAVVAGGVAYLSGVGAWSAFRSISFDYIPNHVRIGLSWSELPSLLMRVFARWPVGVHAFVWMGTLGLLVRRRESTPAEREVVLLVAGVALVQVLGVALQAKFFPYHYGALLPLVALLSVWGCARLWFAPRGRWAIALFALLALHWIFTQPGALERSRLRWIALTDSDHRVALNDFMHSAYDVNAGANRAVAEWIAANTPVHEPIYVWGFEPGIYLASSRRPASRYIYNVPLRTSWGREDARDELMQDLAAHSPSVIVTLRGDAFSHVTGDNADSAEALRGFPRLEALFRERYRMAAVSEDLSVFRRIDLNEAQPTAPGDTR